jgi:two-component system OmpR family response regulator
MAKMLVGETQEDLALALQEYFALRDFTVQLESNGLQILQCLKQEQYAIVILEIALAGLDAMGVVRDYRAGGGTAPILLVAGKHAVDELQCALDAGADSYFVKPFLLSDLAAQVRAMLRRPAMRNERVLTLGSIAMDTGGGTVTRDDVSIHLHPMEFKLLQFLMRNPNQVFSAHALFERVWQKDFGLMEDTVRTHVRTLRQKIDSDGSASLITTVRGLGYKTKSR